jgi:hypothetical protein
VTGAEQFFDELGKLIAKVQQGTLTAADAPRVKKFFEVLAAGYNTTTARLNALPIGSATADEAKALQYLKDSAKNLQFLSLRIGLAADAAAAGHPELLAEFSATAKAGLVKFGGVLGATQIFTTWATEGHNAAGKAAFGVLGGMAGAQIGAAGFALAAGAVTAPALAIAAAAVVGAVGIGYVGGKLAEAAWPWYSEQFLPTVFDRLSPAITQFQAWAAETRARVGEFDGTWLQGFPLTPEQKANFTLLVPGVVNVEATPEFKADVLSLFQAPFAAGELLERDKALALLIEVARELGPNGYTTQRVAVDGNQVTIEIPPAATRARGALRSLIEASVSPAEQPYVSLILPSQLIISLGGGTRTAGAGGALMAGSSVAETLDGGTGADVLLGEAGADTLNGGDRYDTLFGGADDDILVGGAGSDYLLGGTGADRYEFAAGHGSDIVVDSDGQGTLWFEGQRITGGKKVDDAYWISDDEQFGFTRVANGNGGFDLIVSGGSGLEQIRVRDWPSGQLGITLADEPAYPPAARTPFGGDFVKAVNHRDPHDYLFDGLGNYVADYRLTPPANGRGSHDLVFATPRASPAAPISRRPQTESVRAVSS